MIRGELIRSWHNQARCVSGALTIWYIHAAVSDSNACGRMMRKLLLLPQHSRLLEAISRYEYRGKTGEDSVLKSPSCPLAANVAATVTIEPL